MRIYEKPERVECQGIIGKVRYIAVVKHGKGKRRIEVSISYKDILKLADAIQGCQCVYEDVRTGKRPKTLTEALTNANFTPVYIGHAIWHLQNPDHVMPCLESNEFIEISDVISLAAPNSCYECGGALTEDEDSIHSYCADAGAAWSSVHAASDVSDP